jgi:hypothetical protein
LPALHFTHHSSKVPGSGEILIALAVTYAHVPCRRAIARIQVEIKEHERNAGMKREKAELTNAHGRYRHLSLLPLLRLDIACAAK